MDDDTAQLEKLPPGGVRRISTSRHHVFLSYARKDNEPDHDGWVTAFHDRLLQEHDAWSSSSLDVFFDRSHIRDMDDWRHRIEVHLRRSVVFIAFLSPNYRDSETCRWELEAYLEREHALVHGHDGVAQIYFVSVPGLEPPAHASLPAWMRPFTNRHREQFDLRPWYPEGAKVLRELGVRERLEDLRARNDPRARLLDGMQALDQQIVERIERAALAESAPGNLPPRGLATWVGRQRELRQLHETLTGGRVGLVSALHGLGGLGKTALALQYASSFGDHYAAGGRWLLPCEGLRTLEEALVALAGMHQPSILIPRELQSDPAQSVSYVLDRVRETAFARANALDGSITPTGAASQGGRRMHEPRVLVILDNITEPAMLSGPAIQRLPRAEWLHVLVTTRLDLGSSAAEVRQLPLDELPHSDALDLLRRLQREGRFPTPEDDAAAAEIARLLGGFTLAVEAAGAYLRIHAGHVNARQYLAHLHRHGLQTVAESAHAAGEELNHREKQLSLVLGPPLRGLEPEAMTALRYASRMAPDFVVVDWLRQLTLAEHPELVDPTALADPWTRVMRRLEGLRLLTPGDVDEATGKARMWRVHRLVAEHVRMSAGDDGRFASAVASVVEQAAYRLQEAVQHDSSAAWLLPALRVHREVLIGAGRRRGAMVVAGVNASVELVHGQLLYSAADSELAVTLSREIFEDDSSREDARRDLSVSLEQLADLRLQRGQPGDAEQAFSHLQESEQLRRDLLQANPGSGQARRDLSVSLNKLADLRLQRGQPGDAEQAFSHLQESEQLCRDLLQANPGSGQARRDLSVSLYKLADLRLQRGQPGDAEQAFSHLQESEQLRRDLLQANPGSGQARRDLSVSLNKLADLRLQRGQPGDAEQAFSHLQESEQLCRDLLQANPGSGQARRDLSVSLDQLADLRLQRRQPGDAEQAFSHLQESEQLCRDLLQANPGSGQARRDLSVSLYKLADLRLQREQPGDAEQAFSHLQESEQLCRDLLQANPGSGQARRDLSVSLYKLADLRLQREQPGDAEQAFSHLQESEQLRRDLLQANPGSGQARRDLSVSLNKLANLRMQRGQPGDAEQAFSHLQESEQLCRDLLQANPGSGQARRDLSVSLNKLADLRLQRGQPGDAEQAFSHLQESEQLRRDLLQANPGSGQARRDLSVSLNKLANLRMQRGQPGDAEQAFSHLQESEQLCRDLLQANPGSGQARRDLSVSLNKLADLRLQRGQPGDAEQAFSHLQESEQLRRDLLQANPGSGQARRDLSVSLNKLADLRMQRGQPGDAEQAFSHLQESEQLCRDLLQRNPNSHTARTDLLYTFERLAQLFGQRGGEDDAQSALAYLKESVALLRFIAAEQAESVQPWLRLANGLRTYGICLSQHVDSDDAETPLRAVMDELIGIVERFEHARWEIPPWLEELTRPYRSTDSET